MNRTVRFLIIGDVIGQPGRRAIVTGLQGLRKKYSADRVIVNGENAADGFGITEEIATQIFTAGADVITTGNHVWQQKDVLGYLDQEDRILRPANYPGGNPGHGMYVCDVRDTPAAVINIQGRRRMASIDCPFRTIRDYIRKLDNGVRIIIVDFHAEATEEKEAIGCYLDGDVSVVYGTHTHVQTMDERILPSGTGYITDIGATGPADSVIGFDPSISIDRIMTGLPHKNHVAEKPATIHGVVVDIDPATGNCIDIQRVSYISSI
jgi:2',3'-cyclic-nucleotide 2'-phosphodiesterase